MIADVVTVACAVDVGFNPPVRAVSGSNIGRGGIFCSRPLTPRWAIIFVVPWFEILIVSRIKLSLP